MRTGEQREIEAALESPEVQAPRTPATRRQGTVEAVANPQLVAGRAAKESNVRSEALLDLHTLLQVTVLVADEAATEGGQLKESRRLQREESRICVFKPLRMRWWRNRQRAQRECQSDRDANP